MAVEFKTVVAIDSLVALLRVAEDSAVHYYEQDEAFHPGIFPGLILLARFASQRAGEEFRQAIAATEQIRKLNESCDQLQQQLAQVTAERDAARQHHLIECRKYNAEVERRLALEKQVAELSGNSGELPAEPAPEPYQWKAGDQVVRDGLLREVQYVQHANGLLRICKEGLAQQCDHEQAGWKLYRKASDKPAEPAPETYPWQVGDLVMMGHAELSSGKPRRVSAVHPMGVFLEGYESGDTQVEWERRGYELHRKASSLGVQQLTPRKVEASDSTGTDGEGQQ